MFARGGLLVTSDPETWKEVQPQGFENYTIPYVPSEDLNLNNDDMTVDGVEEEPDEDADSEDSDSDGEYSSEDDAEEKNARRFDFDSAINSLPITARNSIKDPATPESQCPLFEKKLKGRIILRCHNGDGWVACKINSYHPKGFRGGPYNFYVQVFNGILKRPGFEEGFSLQPEQYCDSTEKSVKAGSWMILSVKK
jgi:hypothetical protein